MKADSMELATLHAEERQSESGTVRVDWGDDAELVSDCEEVQVREVTQVMEGDIALDIQKCPREGELNKGACT